MPVSSLWKDTGRGLPLLHTGQLTALCMARVLNTMRAKRPHAYWPGVLEEACLARNKSDSGNCQKIRVVRRISGEFVVEARAATFRA